MSRNRDNCVVYTPQQLREAEEAAMGACALPQVLLMEHAALAVADAICEDAGTEEYGRFRVAILAGNGNNGADALATGRMLVRRGFRVTLFELEKNAAKDRERQQSWVYQYDVANNAYSEQRTWLLQYENENTSDPEAGTLEWAVISPEIDWSRFDYVVDGMFGIGLNREIVGVLRDTILSLNEYTVRAKLLGHDRAKVFAVDIPSGIDAGTGEICGAAVRADVTVTFSGAKIGQLIYPGRDYCGKRIVADVGIPAPNLQKAYGCAMMRPWRMKRRDPAGHKGTFGKVLVIAGSDTTPGAAVLAATACYRSGAGMVKVVSTRAVLSELLHVLPEAVLCEREEWLADPEKQAAGYSVAVVGPGLGTDSEATELLYSALNIRRLIHILDADAINLLSSQLRETELYQRICEISGIVGDRCIFTPHPAELARLLGWKTEDVTANRMLVVNRWHDAEAARNSDGTILVMKDATTIVVGNGATYFNETGNDGMGTAGSGDVLAGMCGALAIDACNGYRTLDQCAAQAVALHGLAGDLAAAKYGRAGMKAGDILDAIPEAIREAGTAE